MQKELEQLGVSEKEAKIYLASLEIGRATADQLAKHAKIVRPTTYLQIKSLMEKGLMSTYEEGKKTYFAPESPELLRRLITKLRDEVSQKESGLEVLLPTLLEHFGTTGERPLVRFFPGKEGILAAREEILTSREKRTFVLISPDKLSRLYGQEYLDEYTIRREKLNIHSQGIYTYKETFDASILNSLTERKVFPPDLIQLTTDVSIFDDKVVIISLEGALFGILIQSKQISESIKAIFNYLWSQAKDPI